MPLWRPSVPPAPSCARLPPPSPASSLRRTAAVPGCRTCCRSHRRRATVAASAAAADALLVDAQNVLARCRGPAAAGGTERLSAAAAAAAFADWLAFLQALAQPQLLVAVFDTPKSKRPAAQQRQQLAPEYLQRRQRRKDGSRGTQQQQQPPSAASPPVGGDPLRPFKRRVEELGGVCLEAAPGWEADDGLAAACSAVLGRRPTARVLLATGDGDVQQLLAPQVAWLQLHTQASLQHPLGVELLTAAAFQAQHGFPPAAFPDWQALAGKREASIRGADVGGKTAAKLLARYHSLEAVLAAAAAGELKGWGPAVQQVVEGGRGGGDSSQWQARLRRNRRLFAASADPSVVDARGMQQLVSALEALQPGSAQPWDAGSSSSSSSSGSLPPGAALAWQHPQHARRWRQLQQLAGAAQAQSSSSASRSPWQPQQMATPEGLAVDELDGSCATLYVCPCDVAAGSWDGAVAAAAAAAAPAPAGGCDPTKALMPVLRGPMKHHTTLLKKAGYRVALRLPPPVLQPPDS